VTAVVPAGTSLPFDPAPVQLAPVITSGSGLLRVASERLRLPRLLADLRPDVLVNPNESVPARVDCALVVVSQNLLFHCPGVGPIPAGPLRARLRSRLQFAFYRRQMPRAYGRADVVIPVSAHAAKQLSERAGLDLDKVQVVPYGADRLPVLPRLEPDGPKRLLIVGAVAHYKRLESALAALAELRRRGGEYRLDLIGGAWPGAREALRAVAAAARVAEHVNFVGPVDGEALAGAFAEAHAGLSLSACESFGIPVVEGMRAGLPHVVADEPWSAETVGEAAVRVDADDPVAVADGVELLADGETWRSYAARGRDAVSRYTWEANATRIAEIAAAAARRGAGSAARQ
jgi:glycosyltransferase involved in cell wall biosynthesis